LAFDAREVHLVLCRKLLDVDEDVRERLELLRRDAARTRIEDGDGGVVLCETRDRPERDRNRRDRDERGGGEPDRPFHRSFSAAADRVRFARRMPRRPSGLRAQPPEQTPLCPSSAVAANAGAPEGPRSCTFV